MTQPPVFSGPSHRPQQKPGRSSRRWSLLDKSLATLTALLALATAVFGLWTAQVTHDKNDAQDAAASSGAEASALKEQNNQLQNANTQLQSSLARPTAATLTPTGPTERNRGTITIATDGNTADLDSPPSDPQWTSGGRDVSFNTEPGQGSVSHSE
jgi:hypothetical protein